MVCSYAWFLKYCPNQVFAWAFLNIVSQSDHLNIGNMQLRKRVDIFFFKSWQMGGGLFWIWLLTCVGFAATVWSSWGRSISCLDFQSKSSFRLPVEDLLRENLPGLGVDLKAVLALVPDAVHDVVVHLVVRERPVLVDCIYPVEQKRMNSTSKPFKFQQCSSAWTCVWFLHWSTNVEMTERIFHSPQNGKKRTRKGWWRPRWECS